MHDAALCSNRRSQPTSTTPSPESTCWHALPSALLSLSAPPSHEPTLRRTPPFPWADAGACRASMPQVMKKRQLKAKQEAGELDLAMALLAAEGFELEDEAAFLKSKVDKLLKPGDEDRLLRG
jgi:hypothetical protein